MLKDIVEVRYIGGYRIFLRFEDGISGELDLSEIIEFSGIFEPLKDKKYCSKVSVNPELGTIVWPNGADIDPVVLYYNCMGKKIPDFKNRVTSR